MGAGGEDIQLSSAARKQWPMSFECKAKKAFAFYKDYEQAMTVQRGEKDPEPKERVFIDEIFMLRHPVEQVLNDVILRYRPKRLIALGTS